MSKLPTFHQVWPDLMRLTFAIEPTILFSSGRVVHPHAHPYPLHPHALPRHPGLVYNDERHDEVRLEAGKPKIGSM